MRKRKHLDELLLKPDIQLRNENIKKIVTYMSLDLYQLYRVLEAALPENEFNYEEEAKRARIWMRKKYKGFYCAVSCGLSDRKLSIVVSFASIKAIVWILIVQGGDIVRDPLIIRETSQGNQYYSVGDYLFNRRELLLDGKVSPVNMTNLINQFRYLDYIDPGKEITLLITSPGGEVTAGLAFYDVIRLAKSPVKTVCIGTAASMGAILFLAGDRRCMTKHSQIMLHDPSVTMGNKPSKALAVQDTLEHLLKMRQELAGIIAERTGQSVRTVYSKTKGDTYFNAEEAVEFGLATEILTELP